MSLFKFYDSNYLNVPNRPEVVATTNTYNGFQFKLVDDEAVPHVTDEEVKAGNGYVMFNLIDKPEILNTDDYHVKKGENIRAYRLKDVVGLKFDMSADLVTDAFKNVDKGDFLVGRSDADVNDPMKWKVVEDVTGYKVYLKVVKKTTFGAFTIDAGGGVVPGGYLVEVCSAE